MFQYIHVYNLHSSIHFFIEHSDPFTLFIRLYVEQKFYDDIEYRCMRIGVNAIKGAWLGALVIPLDWDRWWQEWPVSCCIGALFGTLYGILSGKNISIKIKSKD